MNRAGLSDAIEVTRAFDKLSSRVGAVAEDIADPRPCSPAWKRVDILSDHELQELKNFYDLCEANGIQGARSINEDLAIILLERQLEAVA